ncbi:hypothetical protein SAMN05660443_0162 [Marinospirillum celere]|uniref:PAS domain S-box-containing protein n=1 Tax=Marinospirillum celere TaxID=1122252 RepID=A0A1I1DWL2_9GAMM|nr:hypothetical protein SAMN05660443_0162 [Marinospirillum celere]
MSNNQPITQQEYPVRSDCAIISHTDARGQITYVNDEFVEYAGFTRSRFSRITKGSSTTWMTMKSMNMNSVTQRRNRLWLDLQNAI